MKNQVESDMPCGSALLLSLRLGYPWHLQTTSFIVKIVVSGEASRARNTLTPRSVILCLLESAVFISSYVTSDKAHKGAH